MGRGLLGPAAGAAAVLLACAGAGAAETARAALMGSTSHPMTVDGYEPFAEAVAAATDGALTLKLFPGGGLIGGREVLSGIGRGLADMGMITLTYFPAEFAHAMLVSDLSMLSNDPLVTAAAVTEFTLLHCPPCLEEFAAQNIVYTGGYSTTPYAIISKDPVASPADLQGKRVRTPGNLWSRWAIAAGAVPVNVPADQMFEQLSRGIIDAAVQSPAGLRSYGLWDVARNITEVPLGGVSATALVAINGDFWRELPVAHRQAILDHAALANMGATYGYIDLDQEVLAESGAHGVDRHEPSPELLASVTAFAETDIEAAAEAAAERYGIANAAELIDSYRDVLEKWQALIPPVREDRGAVVDLVRQEIFDKIDPASFGD